MRLLWFFLVDLGKCDKYLFTTIDKQDTIGYSFPGYFAGIR